jgi:DHA3 family macrolide efflux protein-like MFS transporter
LAAVASTFVVLLLFSANVLEIWHLFITGAFASAFGAFQWPAYSAAVSTMVPKKQYGRASGMLSAAQFSSGILAPILAALLLSISVIGIAGILIIDVFTFFVAIGALLVVHIPQPEVSEEGRRSRGSLWKESVYGFRYIWARRSLLGLQLVFFCVNLVAVFGNVVQAPMILARTGNDKQVLGLVQSVTGVGGLIGSIALSVWGGPGRKIHGVLTGMALGMIGTLLMGLGGNFNVFGAQIPPLTVWAAGGFIGIFFIPIINGSNQAIWQAKVPPDVQGRVFATRALIAQISAPAAMIMSGLLADNVFEPLMTGEGSLVPTLGGLLGSGPGAGMSLMLVIAGILGILVGIGGYAFRSVRNVETILPDHEQAASRAIQ